MKYFVLAIAFLNFLALRYHPRVIKEMTRREMQEIVCTTEIIERITEYGL